MMARTSSILLPDRRNITLFDQLINSSGCKKAWWQLRINDLATCIAASHFSNHSTLSLNLTLDDPIRHHLDSSQPWQGISGEYTLHLGQECKVSAGHSKKLPQLNASVGGFSRLWLRAA
ncbi:MAG TPA: hypothetical protein DCR00_06900, partial [Gammaproteobacteria bacterium]|nr:hypothetical protein [Gammaproteobacteria bacterium]